MNRTTKRRSLFSALAMLTAAAMPLGDASPAHAQRVASAARVEAPMSLTASDGTGLELVSVQAKAVLEGPLAFTETHLVFRNPRPRQIEGRFRVTLPDGAAISRFAMKLDGRWQEGEVLERQKARRAYEDFLHRRQDPALLEQSAGNEFTARVFPIAANATKEIIISWSHELEASDAPYRFVLQGLPQVDRVDVQLFGGPGGRLSKRRWVPDRDFVVSQGAGAQALVAGDIAVIRVAPVQQTKPATMNGAVVLVDTSASRALGFERQAKLVEETVMGIGKKFGRRTPVLVAAFDQEVVEVYRGVAGRADGRIRKALLRRRALGASDLEAALTWAKSQRGFDRLVLVSDGVATAGTDESGALQKAVRALGRSGIRRLDAVAVGGLRDVDMLRGLVSGGLAATGAVLDGDAGATSVVDRLGRVAASGLAVKVRSARWVWPRVIDGVQAGDERLIYANVPVGVALDVTVGDKRIRVPKSAVKRADDKMVRRAWARARIASLEFERGLTQDAAARKELQQSVIDLSTKYRVLSRFTALLVLETEADYVRYGIDRTALADILTVKGGQLQALSRGPADIVVVVKKRVLGSKNGKAGKKKRKARDRSRSADDDDDDDDGDDDDDDDGMDDEADEAADAPAAQAEKKEASLQEDADEPEGGERADASKSMESAAPPPSPRPASPARDAAPRESRPAPRSASSRSERSGDSFGGQGRGAVAAPAAEPSAATIPPIEAPPWEGPFLDVMTRIRDGKPGNALARAQGWRDENPGDVLALVALGEAAAANGNIVLAARAYGSLIDLFPSRADLRRFAAERLETLPKGAHASLIVDTYAKAVAQRPDHPASHRGLAFARLKMGDHAGAFDALEAGLQQTYPSGRFAGVMEILKEDLGLIAASWQRAGGKRVSGRIAKRLKAAGGVVEDKPSLRFVLNWETDANDVDFHIYDKQGGHAYYSSPQLASGGRLYADVTTGYGPECFTIRNPPQKRAGPYTLRAHYYSRGPMGYGMGKLQVIEHDGKGNLTFEERPFVVMKDGAYVDFGTVER